MNRLAELGMGKKPAPAAAGRGKGAGARPGARSAVLLEDEEEEQMPEEEGDEGFDEAVSDHGDEEEAFMADFFGEVEGIKEGLNNLKSYIAEIAELHAASLEATSATQTQETGEQLTQYMDDASAEIQRISNALKKMDKDNKDFTKDHKGTAEDRIRTNTHGTLTRKFVAMTKEYQELQTKFKAKHKDRMKRQVKIVKPSATAEEVEEILENGDAQELFTQQTLRPGHTAAKNALIDIQERHEEIIRLEQSIQELHQLFVDMATLVDAQGELLDQIENNVSQAVTFTETGVEQLRQANELAKKSRKKMCCIVVFLVIVLVVILGPSLGVGLKSA